MTCSLYLKRAKVDVCLVGDYVTTPLLSTPSIKNYPGIKEISGVDYLSELHNQITLVGVYNIDGTAVSIYKNTGNWVVITDSNETIFSSKVVVATGSSPKLLGFEGENSLLGNGISTCAYCDGSLYENKSVGVIGSGTLAVEDAIYLSGLCDHVTLLCRKDRLSSSMYSYEQLLKYWNIEVLFNTAVKNITRHNEKLCLTTQDERLLEFDGVFYAIGSDPNTQLLQGICPLSSTGYTDFSVEFSSKTGLYACGDINSRNKNKQIVTAAADGCNTALQILNDLRNGR